MVFHKNTYLIPTNQNFMIINGFACISRTPCLLQTINLINHIFNNNMNAFRNQILKVQRYYNINGLAMNFNQKINTNFKSKGGSF